MENIQKAKHPLKCVLIMGGGTGGHVFPGLALANYLKAQGVKVHWLGTLQGLEAKLVSKTDIPLHYVTITGIRGKGVKTWLFAPYKLLRAYFQAAKILRTVKPQLVIGMGGFVSAPGGFAAWMFKYPLIIHEQNACAGLTNKLLGKLAKCILASFPNVFPNHPKVKVVGNPVRRELLALPSPTLRLGKSGPYHLLILGGSLGAQVFNQLLPEVLESLSANERPLVLHQTGDSQAQAVENLYRSKGIVAEVKPFIEDMAQAYAWADIVICRAGALTVAELCAVGVGAILIPYPYAVDDHQTMNAHFMVENEAALCIQQVDLTVVQLVLLLKQFACPNKRLALAKSAYQLRKTDVLEKMWDICQEVYH